MKIPQPGSVSHVMVDGEMWQHEGPDEPSWYEGATWLSTDAFEAFLDRARTVTFYSPTGRIVEPS